MDGTYIKAADNVTGNHRRAQKRECVVDPAGVANDCKALFRGLAPKPQHISDQQVGPSTEQGVDTE